MEQDSQKTITQEPVDLGTIFIKPEDKENFIKTVKIASYVIYNVIAIIQGQFLAIFASKVGFPSIWWVSLLLSIIIGNLSYPLAKRSYAKSAYSQTVFPKGLEFLRDFQISIISSFQYAFLFQIAAYIFYFVIKIFFKL